MIFVWLKVEKSQFKPFKVHTKQFNVAKTEKAIKCYISLQPRKFVQWKFQHRTNLLCEKNTIKDVVMHYPEG